jgi:predicted amidohydrolase YtcJ
LGESQHYINLIDCDTIDSLKAKILEGNEKEPDLPFLIGFNWDQEKLGRLPSVSDLESLNIAKPV